MQSSQFHYNNGKTGDQGGHHKQGKNGERPPEYYPGPMRRNCDMCVRRKVRCCGSKPRCSICIRKGDVCVYSLKRRPGPRVQSNCVDSYTANINIPVTGGTDRYNTRRMAAHEMSSLLPANPQDTKRPCLINSSSSEGGGAKYISNSHVPPVLAWAAAHNNNGKSLMTKWFPKDDKKFEVPSSMKIPDNMVDLMDDSEHLMPSDYVKLEQISTSSLESDTSAESIAQLTDSIHYEGSDSTDFLNLFADPSSLPAYAEPNNNDIWSSAPQNNKDTRFLSNGQEFSAKGRVSPSQFPTMPNN